MLLNGYADIIKYLGRAVMSATTDEFISPYVQMAQDDVLSRALSVDFMAELVQQKTGNSLTAANLAILPKVQKAVAWFAYLAYLPFSIGQDGDNGLQEIGTDSTNPVRMGVLDKRLRETEKNAINALEALLVFLESNASDYPTYSESETATATRSFFIPMASTMSQFIPQVNGNYRLFENIKPYMVLVERDFLLPRIGKAMFDRLKTGLAARDLTEDEIDLLFHIQRAVAHTSYASALPQMQFTVLSSGQIRVLSDFDGIYSSKIPEKGAISCLVNGHENEAKKWQNALRSYLNKNVAKFPLYAAAMASKEPSVNKLPDNTEYKSVFRLK